MSHPLFSHQWLVLTLISLCVSGIVFLWYNKIYDKLAKRSMSSRTEILRLLDLMFVEIEPKKISLLLLLLSFGLGTVVFLLLLPNAIAGLLFASIVIFAGWTVPLLIVKSLYQKRCQTFVSQMVDGMTIMANGIKSGLSVTQAMERVVDNLPAPISQEFGLVLSQIRIGRSVEEALVELGERIPIADVQMFVTSVNILKETGGNLAETFTTICSTIRERQKIERKIEAMTAQGILQGIIITIVPLVLLLVFTLVNPGYVKPMFNTTLGLVILMSMFLLQIIGGLTIRKLVKIKV